MFWFWDEIKSYNFTLIVLGICFMCWIILEYYFRIIAEINLPEAALFAFFFFYVLH